MVLAILVWGRHLKLPWQPETHTPDLCSCQAPRQRSRGKALRTIHQCANVINEVVSKEW
jgi:hypothetical protein